MEDGAQGMGLQINLSLEGLVGVDGSGTEKPGTQRVPVQEVGELLDHVVGITDDLRIDNLNPSNNGGREVLVALGLRSGKGGGAERKDRDNVVDLHCAEEPG